MEQTLLHKYKPDDEPKITYNFVETGDGENKLNKAFDLLFEEVMGESDEDNSLLTSIDN